MRKEKKSEKYDKIVKLMLQDVSTNDIAKITGYSIHTIRNVYEELRLEYNVSSKVGIAASYLNNKISEASALLNEIASITGRGHLTPIDKPKRDKQSAPKKNKK